MKQCSHKIIKAENGGYVCCRCGKEAEENERIVENWDVPTGYSFFILFTFTFFVVSLVYFAGKYTVYNLGNVLLIWFYIILLILYPFAAYRIAKQTYETKKYFTIDGKEVKNKGDDYFYEI